MKLRSPWMYRLVGVLGAWLIRLWMGSLRYRVRKKGDAGIDPCDPAFHGRYIYVFWHETMLYPAYLYAIPGVKVLISRHSDGEFITQVVRRLGFGVIRGSTNRQGAAALLGMIRHGRSGHLAVTPDGPRGPRRCLQPGVVYLAAKTGLPIVPVGFASHRPWRGTNWDRFQIPKPGSVATVVGGHPFTVPADADEQTLEDYRVRIEAALREVTSEAEEWAEQDGREAACPACPPRGDAPRFRPNAKVPRMGRRWSLRAAAAVRA